MKTLALIGLYLFFFPFRVGFDCISKVIYLMKSKTAIHLMYDVFTEI